MRCRVCTAECLMFLDLGFQPIANNFLTPGQFEDELFYHLKAYFCPTCLTVQIGDEAPDASEVFNKDYMFFTGTSKKMTEHFASLADLIKRKYLPENGVIIEIGSNDGTFLKNFPVFTYNSLGIEPSESVADVAIYQNKVRTWISFFDDSVVDNLLVDDTFQYTRQRKANVIVSANVFAHVPDRISFLKNIKRLLKTEGVWINEEPYFGSVMKNMAYDQFYNEHIYYSSIASMRNALWAIGLDIVDFEFIWTHGGSIRYFIGHRKSGENKKVLDSIKIEGLNNPEVFEMFGRYIERFTASFKQKMIDIKRPIVGYGASAKSSTVLNYCRMGTNIISKIYDTTPLKQGKYSPGMHIPVVSYDEFKKDNPTDVILFVWNHGAEVFEKEKDVKCNWHIPVRWIG